LFNDSVRILEHRNIDNKGHGHVIALEVLLAKVTIIANIFAPVRSLGREQQEFYESLGTLIEEFELKYILNEPNLIILGDFNLPLEPELNNRHNEKIRAGCLSDYFVAMGLTNCWKQNDDSVTFRTGQTRQDRIMFRINNSLREKLITDWTFTSSDHCLIQLNLWGDKKTISRRISSLPTYILKYKNCVEKKENGMMEFQSMCNPQWSVKTKLEFLKWV